MQEEKNKKQKRKVKSVVLVEVLSLTVAIVILLLRAQSTEIWMLYRYVDIVTLLLILVLALPTVIVSGRWKDFMRIFSFNEEEKSYKLSELKHMLDAVELLQKQLLYAAGVIVSFHLTTLLYTMDEPSTLGPHMSSILMTIMYVAILELLLMPLGVMVKKKITDFMEEDEA